MRLYIWRPGPIRLGIAGARGIAAFIYLIFWMAWISLVVLTALLVWPLQLIWQGLPLIVRGGGTGLRIGQVLLSAAWVVIFVMLVTGGFSGGAGRSSSSTGAGSSAPSGSAGASGVVPTGPGLYVGLPVGSSSDCQFVSGKWVTNSSATSHTPCVPDPAFASGDIKSDEADGGLTPRCFKCKMSDWYRAEKAASSRK
jgi:hypothetical protein